MSDTLPELFNQQETIFEPLTNPVFSRTTGTIPNGNIVSFPVPSATPSGPLPLTLPASYQDKTKQLRPISPTITDEKNRDLRDYIENDLDVSRLNVIHKHLWLAGLPHIPRPLHAQHMIGRQIILTEKADLHLIWRGHQLFLKPLPEYLLTYSVWKHILQENRALYENATGLLYTYLCLITSKSDLLIAHSSHLLSRDITWEQWTQFSSGVLSSWIEDNNRHQNINPDPNPGSSNNSNSNNNNNNNTLPASSSSSSSSPPNVIPSIMNPRYMYGELRLGRINLIYRCCSQTSSASQFIRGYRYGYPDYSSFFARNFAWAVTVVVYITVVLTAMQVGLATTELQSDGRFQRASFGFTVFAIVGPLAVVGIVLMLGLFLVVFNLVFTLNKRKEASERFRRILKDKDGMHTKLA